ncbi:MAG: hypothetical protein WCT85_02600 [Parachlamydiales bacterium]|jgi:hypothetical protein
MKIFFLPLLFLSYSIFADSITLYNDSPFQLTAVVQSADGNVLAENVMAPNQQSVWDTNQISTQLKINYKSSTSYTPFTVIWRCDYQGYYSVCTNIAAGSMVTADSCPGPHYCQPKPKKEEGMENKTSCRSCDGVMIDNQ